MPGLFYDARTRRLGPLLRGHLLWYERRDGPGHSARAGLFLLLAFALLEYAIGPRMHGVAALGLAPPPVGLRTLILFVLLLIAVKLTGAKWADAGFIPLPQWRAAEWAYLLQALIAATVLFYVLFGARLELAQSTPSAWQAIGIYVFTQMLWGFYQEAVYRGLLQTELTRRFGAVAGVILANIAFTFGPLHLYYLRDMTNPASAAIMLGSIFLMGLVFGFIFARARNVWLIGILHGIGAVFGNVGTLL